MEAAAAAEGDEGAASELGSVITIEGKKSSVRKREVRKTRRTTKRTFVGGDDLEQAREVEHVVARPVGVGLKGELELKGSDDGSEELLSWTRPGWRGNCQRICQASGQWAAEEKREQRAKNESEKRERRRKQKC